MPIDFSSWDADVVIGTCIKWLCGGPGTGWVWVNPRIIHEMKPNDIGWFSNSNPFEFDIHNFEYAYDSARFWGGTPSVASYILASNSIRTLTEIGIHKIHEHNQTLINTITKQLNPETIVSPVDTKLRGGTLVVAPRDRKNTEKNLIEAGVKFDSRKSGIRLSLHIYLTIEQAETVRECLMS